MSKRSNAHGDALQPHLTLPDLRLSEASFDHTSTLYIFCCILSEPEAQVTVTYTHIHGYVDRHEDVIQHHLTLCHSQQNQANMIYKNLNL